jgi:hypothetical protein
MKVKNLIFKYWKMREWECCGHVWQLLLSSKFPERNKWTPVCPTCKMKGKINNF